MKTYTSARIPAGIGERTAPASTKDTIQDTWSAVMETALSLLEYHVVSGSGQARLKPDIIMLR